MCRPRSVRGNREPAATPLRAALQIPFPQTKKSTQKIDHRVGTIADIASFFASESDAEHPVIAMVWKMTEEAGHRKKMGTRPGMEGAPMFSSMVCWVCES